MNSDKLMQTAASVGTPLYIFDTAELKKRIRCLRSMLPENLELCYAMKANAFIIGELRHLVDRFEVCSPGEYEICRQTCIPMEKLVISGVYKAPEDIARMVKESPEIGWYTAESMEQLKCLAKEAEKHQRVLRVLLRLSSGNQFGLSKEEIRMIIEKRLKYRYLDIAGLQFFSGTQKKIRRMKKEIEQIRQFLLELEQEYGYRAREVEYGSGLPAAYFQEAPDLTKEQKEANDAAEREEEDQLFAALSEELKTLMDGYHVTMELGRGIAASCGTYLTSVVDTKTNDGQNYAIVDGGIHHITYYGQMMAMKVPHFLQLPEREGEKREFWNLCGSLCTVNDLIVKQLPLVSLQKGDIFAFERAGAYCPTEGISLFLSRALPAVVLAGEDGNLRVVRDHTDTYPFNCPVSCPKADFRYEV